MAEGLSQESEMHRFVFTCLVLALMAQGAVAESDDHARLVEAINEFEQAVIDSIDINARQAAESYALLATAADLTPWWRELGRLALDTINSVVGLVCDLDDFLTSEGGTKALEDPLTFKKILKEVWMSKDPLAFLSSEVAFLGLVNSPESYKISFQAISDVEELARDVYSVDNDFSSASNAAWIELWNPSTQNGLLIPLINGPRFKEGGRKSATQWENGIGPVRQEIKSSIDNFILGIPDPLPDGYPLEENIAYLNDLSSQIRGSGFHMVNVKSIEADELKTLHVSLGMIKEDRDAASFLYDAWLNDLDVQYKSTIDDTFETITDVTSYSTTGRIKEISSVFSDYYDIKGIIQVPEEFVEIIDKTMPPLDALQDHTIKTNIDLIHETSNLWTLSALTLDYLSKSAESRMLRNSAVPTVLAFDVSPLSLISGESFAINYNVSSNDGSGLKQVELWRKDETSDWQQINTNTLDGENGPLYGSFTDTPAALGKYWYGVHVVDNAGNWNDEGNSNTNGQPSSLEPAEVEVKAVATVREASQAPSEEWNKTFGGQFWDKAYSIESTSDDCYILLGETQLDGGGGYAWLIKTDSQGNEIWKKNIGRADVDWVKSIQPTSDGGYILVGFSVDIDTEQANSDALLIKTDSQGNEIWSKTFGGLNADSANSVQPTTDGGYIIAGETESFSYWGKDALKALKQMQAEGSSWPTPIHIHPWDGRRTIDCDAWLIKTDANGNELWNRTFGVTDSDLSFEWPSEVAHSVKIASNGGYILAGAGWEGYDAWMIKTDSEGRELWNRTFCRGFWDGTNLVQPTLDGGYILTGGQGPDDSGAWLIKTDDDGNEIWKKTIGSNHSGDRINSIQPTIDGGFILAGSTASYGSGAWLIKTDDHGNEIWNETFTFGRASNEEGANSVQLTPDGGYILAGLTTTDTGNWEDAWLIKVAPA